MLCIILACVINSKVFVQLCRIENVVMKSNSKGRVDLPCAQSTVIEMQKGFAGLHLTLPVRYSHFISTVALGSQKGLFLI